MAADQMRFNDGARYEEGMGRWSRLVGEIFVDWLALGPGLRWVDVGCGNGAFTELLLERCAPTEVQGIDPSDGQLAFARARRGSGAARFRQGDAVALPFAESSFDVAVMALVIFFLPEPARGVAEMVRVVGAGGTVASYAWDLAGGGSPTSPILSELRAMGLTPLGPPSAGASRIGALRNLWTGAGLEAVETCEITVKRTFADFDALWRSSLAQVSVGPCVAGMASAEAERLKARIRERLPADADGQITYAARANAIRGRVRSQP